MVWLVRQWTSSQLRAFAVLNHEKPFCSRNRLRCIRVAITYCFETKRAITMAKFLGIVAALFSLLIIEAGRLDDVVIVRSPEQEGAGT